MRVWMTLDMGAVSVSTEIEVEGELQDDALMSACAASVTALREALVLEPRRVTWVQRVRALFGDLTKKEETYV